MPEVRRWEVLDETDISPSHWYPLYVDRVRLPNGRVVDDVYISRLGDVGTVVAVTEQREIVFVRQYRHGVGEIILELPAGRVEGRAPEETARAELEEETGYVTGEMVPLGCVYVAPAKDSTRTHGFLTRVAGRSEQRLDELEQVEVVLIPAREVQARIESGEIRAAEAIALLALARMRAPELFA